jgi:V8-like Glu-specific endopeptidase
MRITTCVALLAFTLIACSHPGPRTPTWNRDRFLRATPSAAAPATPLPQGATPTSTPMAVPATFGRRIGALFYHGTKGDHFCTASAVDSPGRNLIITAAHCLHGGRGSGYLTDLVFVPGYRNGNAPYGIWRVRAAYVDPRWVRDSDPDLDVGFAALEPLSGRNIADVLGTNLLGINQGFTNQVRVTGYPASSEEPVTCVNTTTKQDTYQMRFACKGYYPGTSGSPWLTHDDPQTHRGEVIGVIGGYHLGGRGDTISYSAYFDDDVRRLYETALQESR